MPSYEDISGSFIIKVWLEETADEADQATWRGHITRIQTGRKRYFEDLDTMADVVASYLEGLGVEVENWRSIRRLCRAILRLLGATEKQALPIPGGQPVDIPASGGSVMAKWDYTLNATIGDTKFSAKAKANSAVDAYDHLDVTVGVGETRKLDIQPTDNKKAIQFLLIQRSQPAENEDDPDPKKLHYRVNDQDPDIYLEDQHLLIGPYASNLLAQTPKSLTFTNNQRTAVQIVVLVGRNAEQADAAGGGTGGGTGGRSEKSQEGATG